jgi:uncharacterized lipoprotein YddW (UPF0748 family)
MKRSEVSVIFSVVILILSVSCRRSPAPFKEIKSYDIDFNWGEGGPNGFAKPGLWSDANPEEHIRWYKAFGVNTVQTFCVSCNGYAWYKNGIVPAQPGLKYDFLPEMVRLGHKEGMKVFGYFCIGANTKWGIEHPDLSYGYPSDPHIPFTDRYLVYLNSAIRDAVAKTGIDGIMTDWIWQPTRNSTQGRWIDSEKQLYRQLTGKDFAGEGKITEEEYTTYSRAAIDRVWKIIHNAVKETRPECLIWLTCNDPANPHVINSTMFKEVDWLMNEAGDIDRINAIKNMTGKQTRLITCLADWNKQDPKKIIPAALKEGIGLYGFTKPDNNSFLPDPDKFLSQPVDSFQHDEKNIAALVRAYKGLPIDFVKK